MDRRTPRWTVRGGDSVDERGANDGRIGFGAYFDTRPRRKIAGLEWWEATAVVIVAVALIWQWFFL